MNVTILTYGSRGDVQPFIPLSLGLMARGHSVKLVAPARFLTLAEEHGIHIVPLAGDPAELSRHLNDSGSNVFKMVRGLMTHAIDIGADVLRQVEDACGNADVIIHTFMHAIGAHTLAREKNIPDIHVQLFPMFTPTGDYPNIALPDSRIRSLNRLTHELSHRIVFWISKAGYEKVRRRAGLPKRKLYSLSDHDLLRSQTPVLCAWSPSVIPPSSDWSPNIHVTGYFFGKESSDYQPTPELQKFLDAGNAPICVSFGSMLNRDAEKIDGIVSESLRRTNNRGIMLSGWSALKNASSNAVLYLDVIPHHWLLPRCKMIVHHGGAGTTSAGLRAGIPNIVIPFTADQPFWGRRVHAIGAGPRPVSVKNLSVEKLTGAIAEAGSQPVRRCAQQIGQSLRREDGINTSVALIEKYSNAFYGNHIG